MNKITLKQLIGHRGTAGLRPENTLCSFQNAADLKLSAVEFDVQLTKDLQWVLMHDYTLNRTTNGKGNVADCTLDELCKLQAGLWYKPPYPDEFIPDLQQTLSLCKKLGLQTNIEIKYVWADRRVGPEQHAKLMCEFIDKFYTEATPMPVLSSFELPCLIELRRLMPKLPIGYLIDSFSPDTLQIAQTYNFNSINCSVRKITEKDLNKALDHNIPVLLYTINDKALAELWLNRGVSAVFTDRPDLLLD